MSFETLTVIVLAGLAGPLVAVAGGRFVPVVIGELLAGIVVGRTGLDLFNPLNPTIAFLGQVGFAMLMLTVGMHLPLRDRRLLASVRSGALLAAIVALLAPFAGVVAAAVAGGAHAAIYAVVLASGSVAVLLPALEELGAGGADTFTVMAQVTIADVVTIFSVPIVLAPHRVGHALLGVVLVVSAVLLLLLFSRALSRHAWVDRVRGLSRKRHWALDLRLSLLALFLLAWLAEESGTSVLIAGFGAGVMVAVLGGPKRLSTQMRGIGDGFFIPLFFVVLGAQLDLSALVDHPVLLGLTGTLVALNALIHLLAAGVVRRPAAAGLAATAQLGVPAAVATIGLASGVLSRGQATAIVAAALLSLAVSVWGVELLIRRGAGETPIRTPAHAESG